MKRSERIFARSLLDPAANKERVKELAHSRGVVALRHVLWVLSECFLECFLECSQECSIVSLSGVTLWCHSLVSLSGVTLWCHSLGELDELHELEELDQWNELGEMD